MRSMDNLSTTIMSTFIDHQMTLYIRTCSAVMFVLDDMMMLPHNVMA